MSSTLWNVDQRGQSPSGGHPFFVESFRPYEAAVGDEDEIFEASAFAVGPGMERP